MAGHSIFGIFTSRQGVEAAVQALRDADFRSSDISVLAPENLGDVRDMGTVKSSKAPEGATAGGGSGRRPRVDNWHRRAGHSRDRSASGGGTDNGRVGRSRRRG